MDTAQRLIDGTARCLARHEIAFLGRPVVAAVSGGVDSVILTFALARLRDEGRVPGPIHVAHIDHGTRVDSGANAQFVVDLADRFDFPAHVRRLQLPERPSEEAMRDARYDALTAIADELGAGAIVTAHHADDNIETVLFRMMRGTGLRGLAGMREARPLGPRQLLRPFLRFRRSTIESVHDRFGLPAWEDSSNHDLSYSRNMLRHRTIPRLRASLGLSLDASLMVVARTARAAAEVTEARGSRLLAEHGRWVTPWRLELSLREAQGEDRAFLEETFRQAHIHLTRGQPPLRSWLDRVSELCHSATGQRIEGRWDPSRQDRSPMPHVERTKDGLLFLDPRRVPEPPAGARPFALDGPRQRFGSTEWWFTAHRHPKPPLVPSPSEAGRERALLDPTNAPLPWSLRPLRAGERFRPLGSSRELDVHRWLKRRGIPRFDRPRVPVLVDANDRILWIPGGEIAQHARLELNSRDCIEVLARRGR